MAAENGPGSGADPVAERMENPASAEKSSLAGPSDNAAVAGSFYDPRPELPTASQYKLMHNLTEHEGCVSSVRFALCGKLVASASGDRTAKIWDINEGRCVQTLRGHKDGLNDVAWSWNGQMISTASNDASVRLWDVRTGQCVRKLQAHTSYVMSCAFSAAGDILASAGFDETIRLWDVQTGKLIRSIPAHSDPIFCLDFSADLAKPVLASASNDGICRVWMSHTGECGRSIIPNPSENPCLPVTFCKFTPNNKFLLLGTLASRLQLWDFEPRRGASGGIAAVSVKKTYVGHRNSRYPLQASFLVNEPSGVKYVVSGSEDHHIFLWDLNLRSIVGILRGRKNADSPGDGHCDVVHSVHTNPVEPIIASGGGTNDKTVKLWRYTGVAE